MPPSTAPPQLSRRRWVCGTLAASAGAWGAATAGRAETVLAATESAVSGGGALARLEASLTSVQRRVVALPFSDGRRTEADANLWATRPELGSDFYSEHQRVLIRGLLRESLSGSGHDRLQRQMRDDWGGLSRFRFALYGARRKATEAPGGSLQWQLSGRHLIWRGAAGGARPFSGPLVYGHGEERGPERSLYFYQTRRAQALFESLTPVQQRAALLGDAPWEDEVGVRGVAGPFHGLPGGRLDAAQRPLLRSWLRSLTDIFPKPVRSRIETYWERQGGFAALRLSFYREGDLRRDGVWDVWRVEGPGFVWHFRGAPHVHAFVNFGHA